MLDTTHQKILREISLSKLALLASLLAAVGFLSAMVPILGTRLANHTYYVLSENIIYILFILFLIFGNIIYLFARIGYFKRLDAHRPVTDQGLRSIYNTTVPALTFLIPSYKEDERVIRQSLFSAALQEYPDRQVVLLIDDPPNPANSSDLAALMQARKLCEEIQSLLSAEQEKYERHAKAYYDREIEGLFDLKGECLLLSEHYQNVARWFKKQKKTWCVNDHADAFFSEKMLRALELQHHEHVNELRELAENINAMPAKQAHARLRQEYYRLSTLFSVRISSFERKRYGNLSHEANKAMNLNSYIGLMGKHFQEIQQGDNVHLEETTALESALHMRDAKYIITLDADSMLLPGYAMRLIHIMGQPGNERLAVAQTPYSAIPKPSNVLERTAGATTDIQYLIHQGFTYCGATFWVGANAVLRKAALEDICIQEQSSQGLIRRYIHDRTVIEDTESTIDLIARGWQLFNYPERLAYSATPSDFGSLIIQRGRWANGGLIILPKLIRHLMRAPKKLSTLAQVFPQLHYLTSLAISPVSVVLLLLIPFSSSSELIIEWLPLTAAPYVLLYARDLSLNRYKGAIDIIRVYALNLLLIPVHLGGALKSLQQAITGRKSAFRRTPKVLGRTTAPRLYIVLEYGLLVLCVVSALIGAMQDRWLPTMFALINGGLFLYAIARFIGFSESFKDMLPSKVCSMTHTQIITTAEVTPRERIFKSTE